MTQLVEAELHAGETFDQPGNEQGFADIAQDEHDGEPGDTVGQVMDDECCCRDAEGDGPSRLAAQSDQGARRDAGGRPKHRHHAIRRVEQKQADTRTEKIDNGDGGSETNRIQPSLPQPEVVGEPALDLSFISAFEAPG